MATHGYIGTYTTLLLTGTNPLQNTTRARLLEIIYYIKPDTCEGIIYIIGFYICEGIIYMYIISWAICNNRVLCEDIIYTYIILWAMYILPAYLTSMPVLV